MYMLILAMIFGSFAASGAVALTINAISQPYNIRVWICASIMIGFITHIYRAIRR